jgi:hypothetical protein
MSFIQFISAFGLGAIVTALVQAWLSNRADVTKRNFQEKKESYIGFLDALCSSTIEGTPEAATKAGLWLCRIFLVGSPAVINACTQYQKAKSTKNEQAIHEAFHDIEEAMRKDLGVDVGVLRTN